jgi:ribosomal protein S27E
MAGIVGRFLPYDGPVTLKALVNVMNGQCPSCRHEITLIELADKPAGLVGAVQVGRGMALECQQCSATIYLDIEGKAKVLRKGVH